MTVELITGHAGSAHVSSTDAGWFNAGIVGTHNYVLDTGTQLACTVQSANTITIGVGDAVFEGRHVRVSATETLQISNGSQGMNRIDLVCIEYLYNSSNNVESAQLTVLQGTATSGTPALPTVPSGSILLGDSIAYMRLWAIPINGVSVGTPIKQFGEFVSLSDMLTHTWEISQIPDLPANMITSGTFAVDRIPTLTAAKIPNLPASKITSGAFDVARIPNLAASKITTGTLPVARGGTGKASGTAYMADTLYSNTSGTTGAITLSANAANYTMMEIFYRDNDYVYGSTKVYSPELKAIALTIISGTTNTQNNYKRRIINITGNSLTNMSYCEQDGLASGRAVNNIYIYAVVGYK